MAMQGFNAPRILKGIVECEGLLRNNWVTKAIFLYTSDGIQLARKCIRILALIMSSAAMIHLIMIVLLYKLLGLLMNHRLC